MARRKRIDARHQLAASVLAGETTEVPWSILRSTYFTAKWDRTAARHLTQWADKYGIEVRTEQRNAGPHSSDAEWLRFRVPAK